MNIRSKEYDAFGPWIYIIDENNTLPKLYEPYRHNLEGALMCIKIPREIERRNATPDMHLYDAVVALFSTHILLLNRLGDRVIESRVQINDIVAVKNSNILLLGRIILYLKNDFLEIKYNTVSKKIMEDFVDLIRSNIDYKKKVLNLSFLEYDINTIDYLFAHQIDELRKKDPQLGLVAYQPKYMQKQKKGLVGKISHVLGRNQNLTCSVFLANGKEVTIINRTSPMKGKNIDEYAYSYAYLPTHNIESVKITDDDDDDIYELCLKVGDYEFVSGFNYSNEGIRDLKDYLELG